MRRLRAALAICLGFAGSAWAMIAMAIGLASPPIFAILALAAVLCLAAAYGLITFRPWAAIVSVIAFLGSLGLGYVIYLAIRAAFATFPF